MGVLIVKKYNIHVYTGLKNWKKEEIGKGRTTYQVSTLSGKDAVEGVIYLVAAEAEVKIGYIDVVDVLVAMSIKL